MKSFHITGTCIPAENYMVDTSPKIDAIMKMIEKKDYFVINRPRQFGKTTTLYLLRLRLLDSADYLPVNMSFEGIGNDTFKTEKAFCPAFLGNFLNRLVIGDNSYKGLFDDKIKKARDLISLSKILSEIISTVDKKIVLLIDEVDKSSNNELFLNFLGMLRDKYLNARMGMDVTFHSVILAGVNDIKTLKQKIRPDAMSQQNSPWNIAVPFNIDMFFRPPEIETMLKDYVSDSGIQMDTKAISERIFFWTSGYPFLVSDLCKIVTEEILPSEQSSTWEICHIDQAVKIVKKGTNTLFDVLIKNMENYPDLYALMKGVVLGDKEATFELKDPLISLAYMHGFISCDENGLAQIHNKIFQEAIINYLVSKMGTDRIIENPGNREKEYIKKDGKLDFDLVMRKFQEVIKEKYSKTDVLKSNEFIEKNLRLLFLVYLDPIVNGHGHSFKEVEIGAEKRLDIIVTFLNEMFVVELKIWRGPAYHEEGKRKLKKYMETMSINKGYMLILKKTKTKTFKREMEDGILMVYV